MLNSFDEYVSPFSERYASREMSHLFSPKAKALTFRKLWIALAKGQRELGLPITNEQIAQMEARFETVDFDAISRYEKEFRHDVMAHIHAFGDVSPLAKPILHLGATSTYATDNGDLIQLKEGLKLLRQKLLYLLRKTSSFALQEADAPCLSYTHFQPAQPTTIGKRASLWLQDFFLDAEEWDRLERELPFLGVKGATGTQASFLSLFEGDLQKVELLEQKVAASFGFTKVIGVAGQTYTRKLDVKIGHALASFAASAHKMATDLRLLAHEGELLEGFGEKQVGSSAMPYKRNPIYAERVCGVARFVLSLSQNQEATLATQWLERSLDDSSNRRLSIPQLFLGADALLNLLIHLITHLSVDRKRAIEHLEREIPFLAMENLLMQGVKKGGDRQALHEELRKIALEAKKEKAPLVYVEGELEKRLKIPRSELAALLSPQSLIGCAPEQVRFFIKREVNPFLARFPDEKPPLSRVEF